MKSVKVSIVIVSWNVKELLLDCIRSFYNCREIEIIVIDNNSQDGTVNHLKLHYPQIILLENKTNPGFAVANNQGFALCKGDYIYILNPDTKSSYESLIKMVRILELDNNVGAVSPKIFYGNGSIQKTCARRLPSLRSQVLVNMLKLNKFPFIGEILERKLKYPYDYDTPCAIEACSGAAYLIRRKLIDSMGGFNTEFVHTGEDVELMARVLESGNINYYNPESTLIHYAGQSSKQDIARVQVNTYISTYRYYLLRKGLFHAFLFRYFTMLIDLPMKALGVVANALRGKTDTEKEIRDFLFICKGVFRWIPIL